MSSSPDPAAEPVSCRVADEEPGSWWILVAPGGRGPLSSQLVGSPPGEFCTFVYSVPDIFPFYLLFHALLPFSTSKEKHLIEERAACSHCFDTRGMNHAAWRQRTLQGVPESLRLWSHESLACKRRRLNRSEGLCTEKLPFDWSVKVLNASNGPAGGCRSMRDLQMTPEVCFEQVCSMWRP